MSGSRAKTAKPPPGRFCAPTEPPRVEILQRRIDAVRDQPAFLGHRLLQQAHLGRVHRLELAVQDQRNENENDQQNDELYGERAA